MRYSIPLIAFLFSLGAAAQNYDSSPLMIVNERSKPTTTPTAPAKTAPTSAPVATPANTLPKFPDAAVTKVGETTGGNQVDTPATPASPTNPANPAAGTSPNTPTNPNSPTPPANPVSKLWPKDTIPIFMTACVGFSPIKIPPCSCVITNLMMTMGHDEFLRKSEDNTIEQDPRLQQIRLNCATAPQKKD